MEDGTKDQIRGKAPPGCGGGRLILKFYSLFIKVTRNRSEAELNIYSRIMWTRMDKRERSYANCPIDSNLLDKVEYLK